MKDNETAALLAILSLVAVAAVAGGCNTPDDFDGPPTDAKQSAFALDSTQVRLSRNLLDELEKNQAIAIRLHLKEEEYSIAEITGGEVSSGTVEDGELIDGQLNGRLATHADFRAASDAFKLPLKSAEMRLEHARRDKWRSIGARFGVGKQLEQATEEAWPSAEVVLPAATIRAIAEARVDLVQAITAHVEGRPSEPALIPISQAMDSCHFLSWAHPYGWDGGNIGIYYVDAGTLDLGESCIKSSPYQLYQAGAHGAPFDMHSSAMICTVQAMAPSSRVFFNTNATSNYGVVIPSSLSNTVPPIYVSGISWNWNSEGEYIGADRDYDNRVYNTRIAHFNSAGNGAGSSDMDATYVASPAVGYNVIAVGASYGGTSPPTIYDSSNYIDPINGALKPEITAPGHRIVLSSSVYTGATSASAAMATGFTAALMEQFSFLQGRPALLRAYLFANSIRFGSGSGITGNPDGYGQIDYGLAQAGRWWSWDTPNGSTFTSDSNRDGHNDTSVSYNITSPGVYHVVLSWLVSGTYVFANGKPNMDLDLTVVDPTQTIVASSTSAHRNEEAIRFTVPTAGTYKFRIERYWNSGTGDVVMGLVLRKR